MKNRVFRSLVIVMIILNGIVPIADSTELDLDPDPVVLEAYQVSTILEHGNRLSKETERALNRLLNDGDRHTVQLRAHNWWDSSSMRVGFDQRLLHTGVSWNRRSFPAKLVEDLRSIDLGFGNLYPEDSEPSFRISKSMRIRPKWLNGGPGIAITVPWPSRL